MAIYHVTPLNDLQEHDDSNTCRCNPRSELQPGGDILIIHNAFDDRELVELLNTPFKVGFPHPRHIRYEVGDGILTEVYRKSRANGIRNIKRVNKPDCGKADINGDPL